MLKKYVIKEVSTQKHSLKKKFTYVLIDRNVGSRGSQGPNLEFPLGVMAQYLLIQDSRQFYRT